MKRYSILILSVILFSCNSNKDKKEISNDDEVIADSTGIVTGPPVYNPDSKLYVWRATPDYRKEKNITAPANIINADSLIKGLNEYYENVYLEKIKQGGDTLYTTIKEANFLNSQMGSTGAEMYLADVILNLTTVPGVKYVSIDMEEGDHMKGGTWSADNFKKYKEVIQ
jgi:hypothetical protein